MRFAPLQAVPMLKKATSNMAPEYEPYPWIGSGTHVWVHYDNDSISHIASLRFKYTGTTTIDWGDGSTQETLTNGNKSLTTLQHSYSNGDYRIDISGDVPLYFGGWNGSSYDSGMDCLGFFSDETGFNSDTNNYAIYKDAMVQFETDTSAMIGNGNNGYCPFGATANLRWMKLTEAEEVTNAGFSWANFGLKGIFAPKLKIFSKFSNPQMPKLEVFDAPQISSYYARNAENISYFQQLYSLKSYELFDGLTNIPNRFLYQATSISSIIIPASVSSIGNEVLNNAISLRKIEFKHQSGDELSIGYGFCTNTFNLNEVEIPEGVTILDGEAFRSTGCQKIILPSTLSSIPNNWAFYGTGNLMTLICKATTPPTLANANILKSHRSEAKYYIPHGTLAAYSSAQYWSQHASIFIEMNEDGSLPS